MFALVRRHSGKHLFQGRRESRLHHVEINAWVTAPDFATAVGRPLWWYHARQAPSAFLLLMLS